jgi:hypothetical protein
MSKKLWHKHFKSIIENIIKKRYPELFPSWMSDSFSHCHICGHLACNHGRDMKCIECDCSGIDFV